MSEMEMGKGGYFEMSEKGIECHVKMIKEAAEKVNAAKSYDLLSNIITLYNDPESKFLVKLCNELEKVFPLKCPKFGTAFTGYKVCGFGKFEGNIYYRYALVELEIPSTAARSSAFGNKCRCERALVKSIKPFAIIDKRIEFRSEPGKVAYSIMLYLYGNGKPCRYEVGQEIVADAFNAFRWNECSNGIHFFMTEKEALDYTLDHF